MEQTLITHQTYIACLVGILFGIAWQAWEAHKTHKGHFKVMIFVRENRWRWVVGAIGSFILIRYVLLFILRDFVGVETVEGKEDYIELVALFIGIFGFRIVKILMKRGTSKLRSLEDENNK